MCLLTSRERSTSIGSDLQHFECYAQQPPAKNSSTVAAFPVVSHCFEQWSLHALEHPRQVPPSVRKQIFLSPWGSMNVETACTTWFAGPLSQHCTREGQCFSTVRMSVSPRRFIQLTHRCRFEYWVIRECGPVWCFPAMHGTHQSRNGRCVALCFMTICRGLHRSFANTDLYRTLLSFDFIHNRRFGIDMQPAS